MSATEATAGTPSTSAAVGWIANRPSDQPTSRYAARKRLPKLERFVGGERRDAQRVQAEQLGGHAAEPEEHDVTERLVTDHPDDELGPTGVLFLHEEAPGADAGMREGLPHLGGRREQLLGQNAQA